jgi:hypothetical protein
MPQMNDSFVTQSNFSLSEEPSHVEICGNELLSELVGSFEAEVARLRCLVVELLIKNEELRNTHSQQEVFDLRSIEGG